MADKQPTEKMIATNRKAFRDYEILSKREAGIELLGTEVKSMRAGKINISEQGERKIPELLNSVAAAVPFLERGTAVPRWVAWFSEGL